MSKEAVEKVLSVFIDRKALVNNVYALASQVASSTENALAAEAALRGADSTLAAVLSGEDIGDYRIRFDTEAKRHLDMMSKPAPPPPKPGSKMEVAPMYLPVVNRDILYGLFLDALANKEAYTISLVSIQVLNELSNAYTHGTGGDIAVERMTAEQSRFLKQLCLDRLKENDLEQTEAWAYSDVANILNDFSKIDMLHPCYTPTAPSSLVVFTPSQKS